MEFDLFDEDDASPSSCQCGKGFCSLHGTCHYSDDLETAFNERLLLMSQHGTHGGRRVVRKKLEAD